MTDTDHATPTAAPTPWRHSGLRWQLFTTLVAIGVPLGIAGGISQYTPLILASGAAALAAALASGSLTGTTR